MSNMRLTKITVPRALIIVVIVAMAPAAMGYTKDEGADDTPLVNTTVGSIRGLRAEDGSAMFLGIPYAYVDENNPFGAAIPNPTFDEVFDAVNDSARCPQTFALEDTTLDCLHLNIHVPNTTNDNLLPVFVYIHGGGFYNRSSGRNNIGPKFLMKHDVIFVAFNYRLSVYGFMCLHTPEVPGNQGLKDQLNALRWIKNNIRAFGGDDENITVTGDSAGGISVHLHILFAELGLFQKAITQSGTAFSPWVFHEPNLNMALNIANRMGFETNDTGAAVTFLSSQTSHQVMTAVADLGIIPGPCVEREFPNVERYAPSHPVNTPSVNARNITLLSGYNSDEWLMMYANMPPAVFEILDMFNLNLNFVFDFGDIHDTMKSFVRRFYAADEPMSVNLRRALIDFDSDFVVNHPTQRTLRQHLEHGGLAYHYVFSYVGERNAPATNVPDRGAAHSDELRYLYDMPELTEAPAPDDQLIIDRITTLWTNFAKYGNPTPSTTELLPVQWPPATLDSLNYLNINTDMALGTRPFHQRLAFWDLFFDTNREYLKGYSDE